MTRRSILLVWIVVLASANMHAQFAGQGKVLDSLIRNIDNYPKPDTFRLNALIAVLEQSVRNAAPQKAEKYYAEAMELAKKFGHRLRIANVYHYLGRLYNTKKDFLTALIYMDSAMHAYEEVEDPGRREPGVAIINMDKAVVYSALGDKHSQLQYLLEAHTIYEKIGHERGVFTAMNISNVYRDLFNHEKDLEYSEKSATIAAQRGTSTQKITAYLNYAAAYLESEDPFKAQLWLASAKPFIAPEDVYNNWTYYTYLGRSHQQQKKYEESKQDFIQALGYAEKAGHDTFVQDVLAFLTYSILQTIDWRSSKPYIDRFLDLTKKVGSSSHEREALRRMGEYYTKAGDFKNASAYSQQALIVNDSLLLAENAEQVNQLEANYQFEKKENEINQLQKDKQIQKLELEKKSAFNYILIGTATGLLLVGFLLFRNYRNRQKLQAQRIRELEKDKQIAVTDSILKGQEKERERLAKDLHDGLGGLLSGVKLSLSNMKSNMVITGESAEIFERSLDLLDTSIRELRRVAHNMMPEALIKSGLDTALSDYCKSIDASTHLKVAYQGYGMEKKLDNSVALIIYRIIQELINNVLKHADATEMLVQVMQHESGVSITVEDNGVAFDIRQLEASEGAGWKNIKSRVEYLRGIIDVRSEPGKGTSVHIELKTP